MSNIITFVAVLAAIALASAVSVSAGDITYTSHISPLFKEKCGSCHGENSPEFGEFEKDKNKFKALSRGPRMDSYAHLVFFIGWPDNGAIMRRLDDGKNTKDGKPGNMYQYLGSTEEERQENLALFKEWIGIWNLKKWPDVTKEEMDGLKIEY